MKWHKGMGRAGIVCGLSWSDGTVEFFSPTTHSRIRRRCRCPVQSSSTWAPAHAILKTQASPAYTQDGEVDDTIARLLARSDVDYIHVRDTQAGCYDFLIER
jgi:hypothetical protein